jgi:hypothetical protein
MSVQEISERSVRGVRSTDAASGLLLPVQPRVTSLILYVPVKQCSNCKGRYPAISLYFNKHKKGLGGLYYQCVWCQRAIKRIRDHTPEGRERRQEEYRRHYSKPENREKRLATARAYAQDPANKEKIRESHARTMAKPGMKEKRAAYYKEREQRPRIKKHLARYRAEYRANPENKARQKRYDAEYRKYPENRLRLQEYDKRRKENLEYRERCRVRARRLLEDPQHLATKRIRGRLYKVVRRGDKKQRSMELVGCSRADLMVYLKSTMTPDMTVADFKAGRLHIDHIKPCASFDLTDPAQQKECFHFSNLQLLWAEDNLSKGAKDYEDWLALKEK